jgi:hypothetical protein
MEISEERRDELGEWRGRDRSALDGGSDGCVNDSRQKRDHQSIACDGNRFVMMASRAVGHLCSP